MKTPDRDVPPEKVIRWLRTPVGEHWSEKRIGGTLERHFFHSGVFADVLPDGSKRCLASWPDPAGGDDLDELDCDG